jgi:arabinogalactan oligomer/maltooligosaccharide transport system permease protein
MTEQTATIPAARATVATSGGRRGRPSWLRQLLLQLACATVAVSVLFPVVWIVAMSVDPRNLSKPDTLFPPSATLDASAKVLQQPTLNDVSSMFLAVLIAALSVALGVLAAYALSRMKFTGREVFMVAILAVLMLPAVAILAPLFVQMNKVQVGDFNLRASLLGVALAVTAFQLPFAIWNIKGYLDTIPKELEEAATVDGASRFQAFRHVILPLATPVLAVTAFFGFVAGWTEFYYASTFIIGDPNLWTLAVALNGMVGQYAASTPWAQFAAFSILFAMPVMVVYLYLQRYIISGLTIGGLKG